MSAAQDVAAIAARIDEHVHHLQSVRDALGKVVVGQADLVDGLLIALLADGHVLLEGLPGLAKSLSVSSLAQAVGAEFRRIQFTPDLMPADILGTQVFDKGEWTVKRGPVFANFLLADEINRAPAKVQSALLEAMQERQVARRRHHQVPPARPVPGTRDAEPGRAGRHVPAAGGTGRSFPRSRLVDRLPQQATRRSKIIDRMAGLASSTATDARRQPRLDELLKPCVELAPTRSTSTTRSRSYIVDLVFATREPAGVGLDDLGELILYGASPRASLALTRCARARALMQGRGYVTPQDVKAIALPVLRHRLVPTYEAEAEDLTAEDLLARILDHVPVP